MSTEKLQVDILIRGVCPECGGVLARLMDIDLWLEALGEEEESDELSRRLLLEGHFCLR